MVWRLSGLDITPARGNTEPVISHVEFSRGAEKDLKKLPEQIVKKLLFWTNLVERFGLEHARTIPSFHDEPLHGKRRGQRSIRLNKAYRAIYVVRKEEIEFVLIEEVNKHGY